VCVCVCVCVCVLLADQTAWKASPPIIPQSLNRKMVECTSYY